MGFDLETKTAAIDWDYVIISFNSLYMGFDLETIPRDK